MKKIAVFNHKGGVSKTTTTFNVGWQIAKMGKKVLLVDADSQCNLTLYMKGNEAFSEFYESHDINNIKDALEPAFKSKPKLIEAIECIQSNKNPNLYLMPGHLDLSECEVQLGLSFQLTESVGALENLPGSFGYLFDRTCEKYEIEYVFIDMNPSLSAINQDLFLTSDYFIVPAAPDIFSLMSIRSLARILPMWEKWAIKAREIFKNAEYPLSMTTPKFLGYTINDFNLSKGRPTKAFANQMEKINKEIEDNLIPQLRQSQMLLDDFFYIGAHDVNLDKQNDIAKYCIAEISNFNKLIAISNKISIPVFELSSKNLGESQRRTLFWFKKLFETIAKKIIYLTR